MNNATQHQLEVTKKQMNRQAVFTGLTLGIFIHLLLNVYARWQADEFLMVAMPVASAFTAIAIGLSLYFGQSEKQKTATKEKQTITYKTYEAHLSTN